MLGPRTALFGLGMRQERTLHLLPIRCFVREELDSTPSGPSGNVGRHLRVRYSCGLQCNTDCGRRIEGLDMGYKTKRQNATYVTRRKTRSTTF